MKHPNLLDCLCDKRSWLVVHYKWYKIFCPYIVKVSLVFCNITSPLLQTLKWIRIETRLLTIKVLNQENPTHYVLLGSHNEMSTKKEETVVVVLSSYRFFLCHWDTKLLFTRKIKPLFVFCKLFSLIGMTSAVPQVWHFVLLPASNNICSELTTLLFFPSCPCLYLFWISNIAAIGVLGKGSWYILYVRVKNKQECSSAFKQQINATKHWTHFFFFNTGMDWL